MSWSRPEGKRGVRLKVLRFQIKYDLDMIPRDFLRVFFVEQGHNMGTKTKGRY